MENFSQISSNNPREQTLLMYTSSSITRSPPKSKTLDVEFMKSKIMSHPNYCNLLKAYINCQKIGAPPEMAAKLSNLTEDFRDRQPNYSSTDPELDQFMEAYCNLLVKYSEELTRPLMEAMDFLGEVESQLSSLTNIYSISDEKCEVCSPEEDKESNQIETEFFEKDLQPENRELKHHLLRKYGGYLSGLRQQLSKKKKKGKLPEESKQKLLSWWEMHNKWPYPSETEKAALGASTGLDQKQINNWFINQRKRHWKPSEDLQFVVMDGYPLNSNSAGFCIDPGHSMRHGFYRPRP